MKKYLKNVKNVYEMTVENIFRAMLCIKYDIQVLLKILSNVILNLFLHYSQVSYVNT